MGLISKTIPNLVNGVSQQPPSIRNPTQCEVQENILSDVVYGPVHRPHSNFVKTLWALGSTNLAYHAKVHTINQGEASRYKVIIKNGDLKVFDLAGTEKTVSFPDGKGYLTSTLPQEHFQCLTIGKDTYILNKNVVVTQELASNSYDATFNDDFLVFIKQGDYSTDYTITVKVTDTIGLGVTGPTAVTKTTSATVANDIKTTQIATDLKTGLDAAFPAKLSTIRVGSVLHCGGIGGLPVYAYEISGVALEDSKGNNNARLIRTQIQKFADLPTTAPTYWPIQVVGDKTSGYDDYYVRFFPDDPNSSFGNGSWQESWKTGTRYRPTPATMPLKLTDNEDGTFTCAEAEWDAREAGDTTTNPNPSFIGKNLTGLFTFGNRLGILCKDRVIMSEVGVYTNFYLTTVTTFLDSDPIDIKALNGFDEWLYAVPLAEKIVLFSEKGQAIIKGDGLLTPKNASMAAATRYPVASNCEPLIVGDNIYFTSPNGAWARTYEYYIQGQVEAFKASEVTAHAPQYVPSSISRLTGDDSAKVVIGCNRTNTVYLYKYFWIGDQKVQSSWSKWIFDPSQYVIDASLIDNVVYLVSYDTTTGELVLSSIDLDFTLVDTDIECHTKTHLDFRLNGATLATSWDGTSRTYNLPFTVGAGGQGTLKVYRKENRVGSPRVSWGAEVPITEWVSGTAFKVADPDNLIADAVWIGFPYTSTFTLSEIHLKEEQNGAQVPTESGKLTIKKISLIYNESLYFRVEVTPYGRSTRTYTMTPFVLGDPTPLSGVGPRSDKFTFPVNAENTKVTISIINDSVVPHRIQSAEWVGQYSILSRRV